MPLRRLGICLHPPLGDGEGRMRTLRNFAIVITGAGLIAGVPLTKVQACDDDRYPCPVRSQTAAQETANTPAQPAQSRQPKKRVTQSPANQKADAKPKRDVSRAAARTKVNKPAAQEQAADAIAQKAIGAAPAAAPSSRADQSFSEESRDESLLASAGTAWPVAPNTEGAGGTPGTINAAEAAPNAVQAVDAGEAHEPAHAAATVESPWITYLLLILGAALAAASANVVVFWNEITVRPPSSKSAYAHEQVVNSDWA